MELGSQAPRLSEATQPSLRPNTEIWPSVNNADYKQESREKQKLFDHVRFVIHQTHSNAWKNQDGRYHVELTFNAPDMVKALALA